MIKTQDIRQSRASISTNPESTLVNKMNPQAQRRGSERKVIKVAIQVEMEEEQRYEVETKEYENGLPLNRNERFLIVI